MTFLALASRFVLPRGLMHRRREARVATPATSSGGNHDALVGLKEIKNFLSGFFVVNNRSNRNLQEYIFALTAGLVRPFAVAAGPAFVLGIEAEVHQRIVTLTRFHDDVATLAAIASGRTSARNKFLAPEGHAAVAAVSGLHSNFGFINKHRCRLVVGRSSLGAVSQPGLGRARLQSCRQEPVRKGP